MHYLKLRNKNDNFIWPSFVDALASLLIVIIFILMIFVISQYYISQKLSGKDQILNELEVKILEHYWELFLEYYKVHQSSYLSQFTVCRN